jgi:hypothetical protein
MEPRLLDQVGTIKLKIPVCNSTQKSPGLCPRIKIVE